MQYNARQNFPCLTRGVLKDQDDFLRTLMAKRDVTGLLHLDLVGWPALLVGRKEGAPTDRIGCTSGIFAPTTFHSVNTACGSGVVDLQFGDLTSSIGHHLCRQSRVQSNLSFTRPRNTQFWAGDHQKYITRWREDTNLRVIHCHVDPAHFCLFKATSLRKDCDAFWSLDPRRGWP